MLNNLGVINNWIHGKFGKNKSLRTDGKTLWSYGLIIGFTDKNVKYVYGYIGINQVSATTGRHVRNALKCLDLTDKDAIIPPNAIKERIAVDEIKEKIRNRS